MTISILLDGLLIGLLVATIVYAVVLNRRLAGLRRERESFEKMLSDFDSATQRSEESIHRLQTLAELSSKELQQQTSLARALCDELAFLSDRGETAADQLDRAIRAGGGLKKPARTGTSKITPVPQATAPRSSPKSMAEHELIQALQSVR